MKPMHQMTPAELAAMGWRHGRFKDGRALTAAGKLSPEDLADFCAVAAELGEEYVRLEALPEFQPRWNDRLAKEASA